MSTYTMHWSMRWAIVIAFSGLLLLVGYNVGLSNQKGCTGDLQRFSDGSLYCVRDLGKVTEDSVK